VRDAAADDELPRAPWERAVATIAAVGAAVSIGVLVWELARDGPTGLVVFAGLLAAVTGTRVAFRRGRLGDGRVFRP
jgi:hypothetical protein